MKAFHALLDTKAHKVVIQHAYIRNDSNKPISLAEIERELDESNAINIDGLALPPRILIAWHNGRLTNETGAAHYKTYGVFFFRGEPPLRQGLLRSVKDH